MQSDNLMWFLDYYLCGCENFVFCWMLVFGLVPMLSLFFSMEWNNWLFARYYGVWVFINRPVVFKLIVWCSHWKIRWLSVNIIYQRNHLGIPHSSQHFNLSKCCSMHWSSFLTASWDLIRSILYLHCEQSFLIYFTESLFLCLRTPRWCWREVNHVLIFQSLNLQPERQHSEPRY